MGAAISWPMKRIKFLFRVLLGCFVLCYIFLMVSPAFTPKVNDSDLAVARKEVSVEANGFNALEQVANKRWWPDEYSQELGELARGTNWDAELAVVVVTNNEAILKAFDQALKALEFQVPEYQFSNDVSYLSEWRSVGQIAAIRAQQSFRTGKEQDAFAQALDVVRLGNRMQNGGGPIIHYFVGEAVRGLGLSAINSWVADTKLSSDQLKQVAADLRPLCDNAAALTNSLKAEYQGIKKGLADMRSGRSSLWGQGVPLATVRILPVYNEQKTLAKLAGYIRTLQAGIKLPASQIDLTAFQRPNAPIKLLLSGNVVGEALFIMTAPALGGGDKKSSAKVKEEATLGMLAIKAFQLKHGRLPETLGELVPEFLPAVPRDDYDGKPLSYQPAKRLLYSVGSDFKDDGGVETDTRKHTPDFVFPF